MPNPVLYVRRATMKTCSCSAMAVMSVLIPTASGWMLFPRVPGIASNAKPNVPSHCLNNHRPLRTSFLAVLVVNGEDFEIKPVLGLNGLWSGSQSGIGSISTLIFPSTTSNLPLAFSRNNAGKRRIGGNFRLGREGSRLHSAKAGQTGWGIS